VLYLVDRDGKLHRGPAAWVAGDGEDDEKLGDIDDPPLVADPGNAPAEDVVAMFEKYDRVALPVVDGDGTMLGIITARRRAGIRRAEGDAGNPEAGRLGGAGRGYFRGGFWPMVKKRGGWLAALFLGRDADGDGDGEVRTRHRGVRRCSRCSCR
jgi:magnesium transporter